MKPSELYNLSHASTSFIRLNPHLFGVGKVEARQPEQAVARSLERRKPEHQGGGAGLVVRVRLVAHRVRLFDDDNNTASFKPLRDAIARCLRIDDGDSRIAFECGQVETKGCEGVSVKIEEIL